MDVAAADRAWSRTPAYIRPGGGNAQDGRYERAGQWFGAQTYSDACWAALDGQDLVFDDGRHRFAWLRDHGVIALPFQTSADSAARLADQLGTPNRISMIP